MIGEHHKTILKIAAQWLEDATCPDNPDARLVIERIGVVRDGADITHVRFAVRAETILTVVNAPVPPK